MSDAVSMPTLGSPEQNSQAPSSQKIDVTGAAGVSHLGAATNSSGKGTAKAFNSMEELRKEEPKLYRLMIEGCMRSFNRSQTAHNENFKRIMRNNH